MTERQDPDEELVALAQRGDEVAFTGLMGRYKAPILNFVYRLIGDAGEAEDVAQETFVRAYRNLEKASFDRPGRRFSTWLFQIARNAAIDAIRRRARRPVRSLETVPEGGLVSRRPDPAEEAGSREMDRAIVAALLGLPEDQRTAISLAVYEDLSYAEIADVMKTSEKSVEARLYRARQSLKVRLNR